MLTPRELSSLRRLRESETAPADAVPFLAAFDAWVLEFKPTPGQVRGLISSQLYEHFRQWCEARGWSVPAVTPRMFGGSLRELGLRRSQCRTNYRCLRPYMLSRDSATYFKAWEESHPLPPINATGLTIRKGNHESTDAESSTGAEVRAQGG